MRVVAVLICTRASAASLQWITLYKNTVSAVFKMGLHFQEGSVGIMVAWQLATRTARVFKSPNCVHFEVKLFSRGSVSLLGCDGSVKHFPHQESLYPSLLLTSTLRRRGARQRDRKRARNGTRQTRCLILCLALSFGRLIILIFHTFACATEYQACESRNETKYNASSVSYRSSFAFSSSDSLSFHLALAYGKKGGETIARNSRYTPPLRWMLTAASFQRKKYCVEYFWRKSYGVCINCISVYSSIYARIPPLLLLTTSCGRYFWLLTRRVF